MVDDGEADTSRANDHYTAVASIMCAEASDGGIVYIANGSERMWPGIELLKQSFAANTRKAYDRIHLAKFAGRQSGVGCSCPAGALDGCQRTVNAQTQRSRAGLTATEHVPAAVCDPRSAAAPSSVNPNEQPAILAFAARRPMVLVLHIRHALVSVRYHRV